MKKNSKRKSKQKANNKKPATCFLVRTGRTGHSDFSARVPELLCLNEKKITVVGLGCLGAPSVLEFARCGIGEIRIIDYDIVEAGTIVRWPFGLSAVGKYKTDVIYDFISSNYPYTKIIPYPHRIGEVRVDYNRPSETEVLNSALIETDLIFDASAELGVQHLLSDFAYEMNIPYICISTTSGNWGGRLIRIRPKKTKGCYLCYRWLEADQSIQEPNADTSATVQPEGCASPTFTGAGFDSGIIVQTGVRLAVSTLSENHENGYPTFNWDVSILNLRDKLGNAILPHWQTYTLEKHPSCSCSKKE